MHAQDSVQVPAQSASIIDHLSRNRGVWCLSGMSFSRGVKLSFSSISFYVSLSVHVRWSRPPCLMRPCALGVWASPETYAKKVPLKTLLKVKILHIRMLRRAILKVAGFLQKRRGRKSSQRHHQQPAKVHDKENEVVDELQNGGGTCKNFNKPVKSHQSDEDYPYEIKDSEVMGRWGFSLVKRIYLKIA